MNKGTRQTVRPVTRPYLTGSVTDENTVKGALGFLGLMVVVAVMTFLVCSMTSFDSGILRVLVNAAVVTLVLVILYNQGLGRGADAVARGETMYQRREKGLSVSESEIRVCYHPLKGFMMALIGVSPLMLIALVLAVTTRQTVTGYGTLPSWLNAYMGRSEVGPALIAYTEVEGMSFLDILRVIVRILIMPFISMIGPANRAGLLWVERLSPLILLLPPAAYGIGYWRGTSVRTRIHTEISENAKRRRKREMKARKKRMAAPKGPEQLN